jgi:hypothetical protein
MTWRRCIRNDALYMAHAINDIAAIAGGIVDTSSYIVS